MARYRILFNLPSTTALPRDDVVQTFHVQADDISDAGLSSQVIWDELYSRIGEHISPSISRSENVTVKIYDLADPEPRVPILTGSPGTLDASSSGVALPIEVALCCSLQANVPSGGNAARYRGRIYFGPWNGDTLTTSGSYGRPNGSVRGDIVAGMEATCEALLTIGAFLCIYSRADDAFRAVVRGYCDDEWDTQRRRGRDSSSRLTFVVDPP